MMVLFRYRTAVACAEDPGRISATPGPTLRCGAAGPPQPSKAWL